jgi:stearoyl-CoA desaturase (delta-9 desaturase)
MTFFDFLSYGISGFNLFEVAMFLFVVTHITIVGVTVFLHRCQAHRSVVLNKYVSHFFRFWMWITTGMVTKEWAAIHRKHHAKCESEGDPHSPKVFGFGEVMWKGTELYRVASKDSELIKKYGHGTPDDWLEKNLYTKYSWQGVALMLIIDFILFGTIGIAVWAIQMMWIPFFAAGVINGIGHFFGYRNFKTPDQSRNIIPIGILIGGEELHNNHHSFATSPKLSSKWYEFDMGWFYIRVLEIFGLAKPRRVPKSPIYDPQKNIIDEDTVAAVLASKYELLQKLSITTKKITQAYMKQSRRAKVEFSEHRKIILDSKLSLVAGLSDDFEKIWIERSATVEQIICF